MTEKDVGRKVLVTLRGKRGKRLGTVAQAKEAKDKAGDPVIGVRLGSTFRLPHEIYTMQYV